MEILVEEIYVSVIWVLMGALTVVISWKIKQRNSRNVVKLMLVGAMLQLLSAILYPLGLWSVSVEKIDLSFYNQFILINNILGMLGYLLFLFGVYKLLVEGPTLSANQEVLDDEGFFRAKT